MDINNSKYYDSLAGDYADISAARLKYLNGVDNIVSMNLKDINADRLLDLSAGDGQRCSYLAERLGISHITAIESSFKMAEKAQQNLGKDNVIYGDILKLDLPEGYYDAVISLWNVFGHFPDGKARIAVLKKIAKTLRLTGRCIIDVNNRYNLSHYGYSAVVRNIFFDLVGKRDSGWFPLQKNSAKTKVYLHRPLDMLNYISDINLRVIRRYYIDYENGTTRRLPWNGQCVYVLGRIE